jgi:hypothetical protein
MPEQFQNKVMTFAWSEKPKPLPKQEGGLSHEIPEADRCVSGRHNLRLTACYCHWTWDATPMHGGVWVEPSC